MQAGHMLRCSPATTDLLEITREEKSMPLKVQMISLEHSAAPLAGMPPLNLMIIFAIIEKINDIIDKVFLYYLILSDVLYCMPYYELVNI